MVLTTKYYINRVQEEEVSNWDKKINTKNEKDWNRSKEGGKEKDTRVESRK